MDILGHGIDVVAVPRVAALLAKNDDFLLGWFTTRELSELAQRASQPDVIAGRVAAKEAVVKALGCGFDGDVSWQDVEILSTDAGAPTVALSGRAAIVAKQLGVKAMFLSISNESELSVASVITTGAATAQRT